MNQSHLDDRGGRPDGGVRGGVRERPAFPQRPEEGDTAAARRGRSRRGRADGGASIRPGGGAGAGGGRGARGRGGGRLQRLLRHGEGRGRGWSWGWGTGTGTGKSATTDFLGRKVGSEWRKLGFAPNLEMLELLIELIFSGI